MAQWLSNQAKQQWQRICFSALAGVFSWWYIHETQISTKVFSDVPIFIQGLPPGKTLGGLRKDGRLMRPFSLTLKGRKKVLETINTDQIEVLINATGKGDVWKEEVTLNSLRCLNPEIQLNRIISEINHPPLQIRLTTKASRDIPVAILPPSGSLPKGYRLIDIWPDQLVQSVEGPEEAVQALTVRKLFLTFDLNRITKQQLERLGEELTPGSEIYFKIPESWKYIELPAPFGESRPLQDPEAENLTLVILKPAMLSLDSPLPIRISPLPVPLTNSPILNYELKVTSDELNVQMINHLPHWIKAIYVEGISKEFLQTIQPHLELVVYVGTKGSITCQVEVANSPRAEQKYIQKLIQTHFERNNHAEMMLQKRLTKQFWYYMSQMKFYGPTRRSLEWEVTLNGSQLSLKEAD
jgi:hypothetical protein